VGNSFKRPKNITMNTRTIRIAPILAALVLSFVQTAIAQAADPLPSWNDGNTKQSNIVFPFQMKKGDKQY
jgi:hypothetical protein